MLDWKSLDGRQIFVWSFVDHGHDWPYVIYSQCSFVCNETTSKHFAEAKKHDGHIEYIASAMKLLVEKLGKDGLTVQISDAFEKMKHFELGDGDGDGDGSVFRVVVTYRRMGMDTGFDTLVHLDNN